MRLIADKDGQSLNAYVAAFNAPKKFHLLECKQCGRKHGRYQKSPSMGKCCSASEGGVGSGRRNAARQGLPGFENFSKKIIFLVSSGKKQISPLLPLPRKVKKIPLCHPWKKSFRRPCKRRFLGRERGGELSKLTKIRPWRIRRTKMYKKDKNSAGTEEKVPN